MLGTERKQLERCWRAAHLDAYGLRGGTNLSSFTDERLAAEIVLFTARIAANRAKEVDGQARQQEEAVPAIPPKPEHSQHGCGGGRRIMRKGNIYGG